MVNIGNKAGRNTKAKSDMPVPEGEGPVNSSFWSEEWRISPAPNLPGMRFHAAFAPMIHAPSLQMRNGASRRGRACPARSEPQRTDLTNGDGPPGIVARASAPRLPVGFATFARLFAFTIGHKADILSGLSHLAKQALHCASRDRCTPQQTAHRYRESPVAEAHR